MPCRLVAVITILRAGPSIVELFGEITVTDDVTWGGARLGGRSSGLDAGALVGQNDHKFVRGPNRCLSGNDHPFAALAVGFYGVAARGLQHNQGLWRTNLDLERTLVGAVRWNVDT